MKRTRIALAAVALTAAIAPPVLVTAPAHSDPCFFSAAEFSDWYNGARWGRSLANIQADVACQGAWDNGGASVGTWNGNPEKARLWPRSDGGQTELYFALDNAGVYHVHDEAWTGDLNVGGGHFRRECEWLAGGGRPAGNPCTPSG